MNNPTLSKKSVEIVKKILSKNDLKAKELREFYKKNDLYVLNLLSSPGSGKTTLLESLAALNKSDGGFNFGVIEGDLETSRDAERLQKKGVPAYQIATGEACHLEAFMVENALKNCGFDFSALSFLVIENVGNLVCPASYDLGAALNITLLSTPEGDDKVAKYPSAFACADIILISKADLKAVFDFDIERVLSDLEAINPRAKVLEISSKNLDSIRAFCDLILESKSQNFWSDYSF